MPQPTDEPIDAAEMIREYRDGGPSCAECDIVRELAELRGKVGELKEYVIERICYMSDLSKQERIGSMVAVEIASELQRLRRTMVDLNLTDFGAQEASDDG